MKIEEAIGHLKVYKMRFQKGSQEKKSRYSLIRLSIKPKGVQLQVEEDVVEEEKGEDVSRVVPKKMKKESLFRNLS